MKKLRNHSLIKEQENSPEAANNETDLCNLTDIEFKREIVKILKELRLTIKELRADMNSDADFFGKELENMRNIEKLENSFAETQTELKAQKRKVNNADDQISDLEDRIMEIIQSGQQRENQVKQHESNIRDPWDNIEQANLHIIGISEGEEKEKGIENIFKEIMAENFPNLKETDIKIQEAQKAPNKLSPNKPIPRHIIIKMVKVKDKEWILEAARKTQNINYKGTPIRLSLISLQKHYRPEESGKIYSKF
uniref:L1 transposable element RRM domain-containing protein n=1 Tax=Sus scrofa TaxID=9823 RepID=A0A8D0ME70_PIG